MGELIQGPWRPFTKRNLYILHLCRELGKPVHAIEYWMQEGLPYARDSQDKPMFNLLEVLGWLDQQDERKA